MVSLFPIKLFDSKAFSFKAWAWTCLISDKQSVFSRERQWAMSVSLISELELTWLVVLLAIEVRWACGYLWFKSVVAVGGWSLEVGVWWWWWKMLSLWLRENEMSGVDLEGSKLFCRIDMVKKDILTQTQVSVTVYMVPAVLVMREREGERARVPAA